MPAPSPDEAVLLECAVDLGVFAEGLEGVGGPAEGVCHFSFLV